MGCAVRKNKELSGYAKHRITSKTGLIRNRFDALQFLEASSTNGCTPELFHRILEVEDHLSRLRRMLREFCERHPKSELCFEFANSELDFFDERGASGKY